MRSNEKSRLRVEIIKAVLTARYNYDRPMECGKQYIKV